MKRTLAISLILAAGGWLAACAPVGNPVAQGSPSRGASPSASPSPTPDAAQALIAEADELQKDGRANEARYAYNAALEKFPNNPTMLTNRASCEVALAEFDAAIADLQKAREIHEKAGQEKEAAQARLDLALVYIRMKKDTEAITAIGAALPSLTETKQDSLAGAAYFYRGSLELKRKTLKPALEDLTHAVALAPDDANVYEARSRVQELLHQPAGAAADLEKAAGLVKDSESAELLRKAAKKLRQQKG